MKSIVYCVLSALMVAAAEARAADRFVVAERGTPPQTTIWCSNAGLEVEKYAANELRNYVRRITLSEKVGKVVSADFGSTPNVDGNTVNVSLEPIGYRMLRSRPINH